MRILRRKIEENKLLYYLFRVLKFIFKVIFYILYQLKIHWKISLFLFTSMIMIIFDLNYKEILYNLLNKHYLKLWTLYHFHNNIYVPLYALEIYIIVRLFIVLVKYYKIEDYKKDELTNVINLKNGNKQPPFIVKLGICFKNIKLRYMIINLNGLPNDILKDTTIKKSFQSSLNINIVDHKPVKHSQSKLKIIYTSPRYNIPDFIEWKDKYIIDDEISNFNLILGCNITGQVKTNLNKTPHISLGGITNSGKSNEIECIAYQCAKKHAVVFYGDLKGTDFNNWHNLDISSYNVINKNDFNYQCRVATTIDDVNKYLQIMYDEYVERKIICSNKKFKNINQYNKYAIKEGLQPLSKIIFIFDEVAMLQSNQNNKDLVKSIEDKLMIFATQGRAFGCHLLLSTQRPDCKLMDGQVRSNMDVRICGRTAERGLSEIVLGKGNYDADELIGKDEVGMFVMNNGKLFRGYYFNSDETLKRYMPDTIDDIIEEDVDDKQKTQLN